MLGIRETGIHSEELKHKIHSGKQLQFKLKAEIQARVKESWRRMKYTIPRSFLCLERIHSIFLSIKYNTCVLQRKLDIEWRVDLKGGD